MCCASISSASRDRAVAGAGKVGCETAGRDAGIQEARSRTGRAAPDDGWPRDVRYSDALGREGSDRIWAGHAGPSSDLTHPPHHAPTTHRTHHIPHPPHPAPTTPRTPHIPPAPHHYTVHTTTATSPPTRAPPSPALLHISEPIGKQRRRQQRPRIDRRTRPTTRDADPHGRRADADVCDRFVVRCRRRADTHKVPVGK